MAHPQWLDNPGQAKLIAGLMAIFFGMFGVHKFVLGYTNAGLVMLLVTLLTCGFAGTVMYVIGIIEGIIYLTTPDEQFARNYIENQRQWF